MDWRLEEAGGIRIPDPSGQSRLGIPLHLAAPRRRPYPAPALELKAARPAFSLLQQALHTVILSAATRPPSESMEPMGCTQGSPWGHFWHGPYSRRVD